MTLPNLRHLRFQGVSTYLECLVAQIRAPLERLDITLFNQIAFALPHLSHLINTTEAFKLPIATVLFGNEVSISTDNHITQWNEGLFTLRVMCKELDWQIDCAAQICCALMPALSGVQKLRLSFDDETIWGNSEIDRTTWHKLLRSFTKGLMPTKWENGEIDGTTWHELLGSFIGVTELHIYGALSRELSRALQVNEVELNPGLLPGLQEIQSYVKRAERMFGSFIDARRVAGRPVRSTLR